jgi:hypothetical protein
MSAADARYIIRTQRLLPARERRGAHVALSGVCARHGRAGRCDANRWRCDAHERRVLWCVRARARRLVLLRATAPHAAVAGCSTSGGALQRQASCGQLQSAAHGPPTLHLQPAFCGTLHTQLGGASPLAGCAPSAMRVSAQRTMMRRCASTPPRALQVHVAPQGPPGGQPQPSTRVSVMFREAKLRAECVQGRRDVSPRCADQSSRPPRSPHAAWRRRVRRSAGAGASRVRRLARAARSRRAARRRCGRQPWRAAARGWCAAGPPCWSGALLRRRCGLRRLIGTVVRSPHARFRWRTLTKDARSLRLVDCCLGCEKCFDKSIRVSGAALMRRRGVQRELGKLCAPQRDLRSRVSRRAWLLRLAPPQAPPTCSPRGSSSWRAPRRRLACRLQRTLPSARARALRHSLRLLRRASSGYSSASSCR